MEGWRLEEDKWVVLELISADPHQQAAPIGAPQRGPACPQKRNPCGPAT